MPRPKVAATSVLGSPGLGESWETATEGRFFPSGAYLSPFLPFEENTPTAVATMSCLPCTSGQVACTAGRVSDVCVNVAPASVVLYPGPPAALEASSPSEPSGAK